MSKQGTAIHPEIGSLIRKRDYIQYHLSSEKYFQSLRLMKLLLLELKPKDQNSEAGKKIFTEIDEQIHLMNDLYRKGYHHVNGVGMIKNYTLSMSHIFEDIYRRLNNILWNEGYLLNDSYRVIIKEDSIKI